MGAGQPGCCSWMNLGQGADGDKHHLGKVAGTKGQRRRRRHQAQAGSETWSLPLLPLPLPCPHRHSFTRLPGKHLHRRTRSRLPFPRPPPPSPCISYENGPCDHHHRSGRGRPLGQWLPAEGSTACRGIDGPLREQQGADALHSDPLTAFQLHAAGRAKATSVQAGAGRTRTTILLKQASQPNTQQCWKQGKQPARFLQRGALPSGESWGGGKDERQQWAPPGTEGTENPIQRG